MTLTSPKKEVRLHGTILLFLAGLALIVKGGDYFVGASVAIARFKRIPRIVIGTTIVSIATTSPELVVSSTASLTGRPGIAIGNAVGSAIANIGFILALTCMVRSIPVRKEDFRLPALSLLAAAVLLTLLTIPRTLSRGSGLLMLLIGLSYLAFDYFRHKRRPPPQPVEEAEDGAMDPRMRTLRRAVFFFLVGLAMVIAGSKLMIGSGVKIATWLGVSPMFIGLTFIAFGTSLPELVTAIASVRKRVADLSLGNIVGAGFLNCTVVSGAAAAIHPLTMSRTTQLYNMPALIVVVVTLITLARAGGRLSRRDGAILLALYAAYISGLVILKAH
jgi:cation:H+ antiporter